VSETVAQGDLFAEWADLARRARDLGMKRAAIHADEVQAGWTNQAYAALRCFLATKALGATFISEEVRAYATEHGMPDPPDDRAWGSVMTRGAKAGLYRRHGFTTSINPAAHCRPVTQWVKQ